MTVNDYNGRFSLIYNKNINDFVFIFDNNFNESCDSYNQEEESDIYQTNNISEIKSFTDFSISDIIKEEKMKKELISLKKKIKKIIF